MASIKKFYDTKDIELKWKKIKSYVGRGGKKRRNRRDRLWQSCYDCGLYHKQQEFDSPGQQYQLDEGIKNSECARCSSKNFRCS
jgi:hypothetical protein